MLALAAAACWSAAAPREQVAGAARCELELGLAARDAFEVEDVVDQAHQAIGVAKGDLEHLVHLFGTREEGTTGDQAERGAKRGERGAELVRDGRDELVLHAIEGAALGGVSEGDDDADGFAGLACDPSLLGFDLRAGDVLDGEAGAVLAEEDLVRDAHGLEV